MTSTRTRPRAPQAAESTGLDYEMTVIGEIGWDITGAQFLADLKGANGGPVCVFIDSVGGDVFEGVGIYQALLEHPGRVTIRVGALAASAASVVAMAADELVMSSSSLLMAHDAWTLTVGDAADHRKAADLLDLVSDNIAGIYAARTGGTAAEWRKVMRSERWFSASEAVEIGLADRVSDGKALNARVRQACTQAPMSAAVKGKAVSALICASLRDDAPRPRSPRRVAARRRPAPNMTPLIRTLSAARRAR